MIYVHKDLTTVPPKEPPHFDFNPDPGPIFSENDKMVFGWYLVAIGWVIVLGVLAMLAYQA